MVLLSGFKKEMNKEALNSIGIHGLTTATDWWSLGVIAHEMFAKRCNAGRGVFRDIATYSKSKYEVEVFKDILEATPRLGLITAPFVKEIVSRLLEKDVHARLSSLDELKSFPAFRQFEKNVINFK